MKYNMTIGSDPEFHIFDTHRNKMVSAIPIVKRDKHDPIDLGDGFKFYYDNVLVECSMPPGETHQEVISNLRKAFSRMQDALGDRYRLVPKAAHVYDIDEIGAKPKKMRGQLPIPWEIGCNPSYDAYKVAMKIPDPFTDGLRTGSFHIHVGHEALKDFDMRHVAIRLLDIFLGCSSVLFDKDETANQRRILYGRAGEFRPTSYGVEYRCLGPFAMQSPDTVQLSLDLVTYAINRIEDGSAKNIIEGLDERVVQEAINTSDKTLAMRCLKESDVDDNFIKRSLAIKTEDFHQAWGI